MVLQKPEDRPADAPAPESGPVAPPPDIIDEPEPAAVPDDGTGPLSTPQVAPLPPQPTTLSDSMRNILLIISGVFLLMAICSAWLLWQSLQKDDDKKPATSQSEDKTQAPASTAITCADDLTVYKNQDLGVGFCYPAVWGAVTVANGRLAGGDIGKRWKVTFADKKAAQVDIMTKDWSTTQTNDAACSPTSGAMPAYAPLATTWTEQKEATNVVRAARGIEASADKYVIQEFTEAKTLKGACLQGYSKLAKGDYDHTVVSYKAGFNDTVKTPQQHEAAPNTLIPTTERTYLQELAKSVQAL